MRLAPLASARRRLWPAVAGVVGAGLLLSACGSNGEATKPGPQIVRAAAAAVRRVTSFEMTGVVATSAGTGTFTFQVAGKNHGQGTFQLGTLEFHLDRVGSTDYLRSSTLWGTVGGTGLQALLTGHWVSVPASNPIAQQLTGSLSALMSTAQTATNLEKGAAGAQRLRTETFHGQGVVEVKEGGGNGVVLVATSGHPYPLRMADGKGTSLTLSKFGQSFSVNRPKKSLNLLNILAGLQAGKP